MQDGTPSVSQILEWGIRQLSTAGVDNPRLDAAVLLAHTLSLDRVALYREPQRLLTVDEKIRYLKMLERRQKREPVAYITGYKEFWSRPFTLTQDVLIPRPETEILFEQTVKVCTLLLERKGRLRILELGTGSGILAVSLAKEIDCCTIFATDISARKLEVARENARLHKVESLITLLVGNLLQPITIRKAADRFDCVVCNPPYLSAEDWKEAQPEIRDYEPFDALWGGEDGLDCYRALIPDTTRFLQQGGYVILEVGSGQAERVLSLMKNTGSYQDHQVFQDLAGVERVILARI